MAIALTVAKIMARHRDKIKGRIKFVLQPGEEGYIRVVGTTHP